MQTQLDLCRIYRKICDLDRITPYLVNPPKPSRPLPLPPIYSDDKLVKTYSIEPARQLLPTEQFLKQLNSDKNSKRQALISYPQIFDWYPELREIGTRMLEFGNVENIKAALSKGKIGSDKAVEASGKERDAWGFAQELMASEPVRGQRLASLLSSGILEATFNGLTQECDELGYDLTTDKDCKRLEEEKSDLANSTYSTGIKIIQAKESLIAEFPRSSYSVDFGIKDNTGLKMNKVKFNAELGELLGYPKEDIFMFLFTRHLPKDIAGVVEHNKFRLTDEEFVGRIC